MTSQNVASGDAPDVLVIGAGVVGLSCALALLKEGRSVLVLDKGEVGCGSSHGNCGTITPSHAAPLAAPGTVAKALRWMARSDAPLYVKPRWDPALMGWFMRFALRCNHRDWLATTRVKADLLVRSRNLLQDMVAEEGIACDFASGGLWYVFRTQQALDAMHAENAALAEFGIRSEVIEGATARAAEPALNDSVLAAIQYPDDASLRPDTLVAGLARRVRELGGRIETGTAVQAIDARSDGVACSTTSGVRTAAHVVLACGAWSPELSRRLGVRLPVQPGKGYSITYDRPALAPKRPLVLEERSVCVSAWPEGFRLGSTMEFSGYDTSLNRVRLDALERGAAEYLREPHGAIRREEWYGWRPMTYDDLPIIGAHPRAPRVVFATGHGMLGVSLSAITGRLVADLVSGRAPEVDPAPLSPQRFG